ncbi:MAG: DivIVA domain-containing protein [Actinomycetota bacterium]
MGAEFDPPLVEMVKRKRKRRFASAQGGFDPAQVDAFLVAIASGIEALEAKLHEFRVTPPSPAEDADEGSAKRLARLGEVAERAIEQMLVEAKAEAATIVSEARSEADLITRDAQGVATRPVDEARAFLTQVEEDARRISSNAAERRRQMVEEIRKMQERLLRIAKDLDLVVNPEGS